jgi:hypothetical protein
MIWQPSPAGAVGHKHNNTAMPLLVGGTVKQATTFLSLHIREQRQLTWSEYISAAQQPLPLPAVLPEHLYDE